MLVKLFGKRKIYKMYLPEEIEGNYWICDYYDNEEHKLINIKSINGKWVVVSNKFSKIINQTLIKKTNNRLNIIPSSDTIIKAANLENYHQSIISLKNTDDLYGLYCFPTYEENVKTYKFVNNNDIIIGSDKSCDIIVNDLLVRDKHARIFMKNGRWYVENYDDNIGIFLNEKYIEEDTTENFKNGDILAICGLRIMILDNCLNIMGDNFIAKSNLTACRLNYKLKSEIEEVKENDETIELYSETDYFYSSPRIREKDVEEAMSIDRPPDKDKQDNSMQIMSLMSSMGMVLTTVVSLIITIVTTQNSGISLITKIITSCCMLLTTLAIPIIRVTMVIKKKKKKEKKRQHEYKKYINSKIIKINDIMLKEGRVLKDNNLIAEQCERAVLEKTPELWSRKIEDVDFLNVNLGSGDQILDIGIEKEDPPFKVEKDQLSDIYYKVINSSRIIKDVPVAISLVDKKIVSIISKNQNKVNEYLKNIILQLVALQNYRILKLVFFVKNQEEWDFVKLIPHVWDDSNTVRFFGSSRNDINEISQYLEEQLSERLPDDDYYTKRKIDYKDLDTYYLIITDNYRNLHDVKIIDRILNEEDNLGFSLLCVSNDITQLPNKCKTFIELDGEKASVFENQELTTVKKEFSIDKFESFDYSKIANVMANIPIKYSSSKALTLPSHYNFLEMFNAGNIDQLNIFERWKNNDSTTTLQAQIGIDVFGNPIYLDAHEKYHGPHGLIAGTTGSGKSEFIITYILSLAINYHPDNVTFVLIDYKGGGLAGVFKKRDIQLPHLVGTITNIDSVGLQRSLESIQSELRRRQVKFNEAKNLTNESTIDIYKYQKYYHEGVLTEPISHLFIICDEFAELKQQQPDFMAELMSVSRIGRSLGVHLILATQKPAGIVNDQIRSNSKFGICLKVQDRSDSKDIIKRPDASTLKNAGQFYINVGNDEYFALGQSGYTGVPYVPSNVVKKEVDDSVDFVSNTGNVIKSIETKNKNQKNDDTKKRGDQLTNIVSYLAELAKRKNISENTLWLEPIPANIYISKLRKKYKVKAEGNDINPIIGEYDDPFNQLQNILTLNLSKDGNTIIYGSGDSGKELVLYNVLYDTMINHTTEEVQFYIIDYGSETLSMFRDAPNVGDVMLADDTEKIIRMFKMIRKEIKNRKEKLLDYNGDYRLFLKNSGKKMPMIVVMINEFGNFLQAFSRDEDEFNKIFKECNKFGIVFILTASMVNELKSRTTQSFRRKLTLQLISNDYTGVFSKARKKKPSNIYGRGLCTIEDDDIYEFQTAKMFMNENVNDSVKLFIEKLKKKNTMVAPPIPIVPNVVHIDDVKDHLKGLSAIPIGISTRSIEPCVYNFEKDIVTVVSASDIDKTEKFITALMDEIKLLDTVQITMVDELELFRKNQEDFVTRFNRMTERLNANYLKREEKRILYIIVGIGRFLEQLGSEKERFTSNLNAARLTQNCNFIVIDNYMKLRSCQMDTWFKKYVVPNTGIYVGTGFDSQSLFATSMERRDIIDINDTFGYSLTKKKTTPIKILGMELEEDSDE